MTPLGDLPQQSRGRILEGLLSRALPPGGRLVERPLAQELGVSRIPLREAMAQLVTQGVLVRERPRGGVRVREYGAEEARQVFELREALEVGAARVACQRATESDLLRLEVLCEEMKPHVGAYGSAEWAALDRTFHEALVAASHNERFTLHYGALLAETDALFYRHPARLRRPGLGRAEATRHMAEVREGHLALARVLRSRDADATEAAVRAHLQAAAASLVRSLVEYELRREEAPAPRRRNSKL